ncbi:MAG TPA: hypothetical protein VHK88_12580 [Aquihabitans sp.]|nr:hypothetical protein [Aquihabitans sp.]
MLAYLDAGTGQMIVAALAGGAAGVGVLFRMYGNRFLGVFSKKRRRQAELAQGDLLGVEIDPETGEPVAAEEQQPTIGDRS